jgi:hypothetical protein
MLTRTRITTPGVTDSEVLAMVLDEMQSRGLLGEKPDEDKKPSNEGEPQAMWSVEETLCL